MDLGPGGLSSPGPSGFGGGYNATGTGYDASGGSNEPVTLPAPPSGIETIRNIYNSPVGQIARFVLSPQAFVASKLAPVIFNEEERQKFLTQTPNLNTTPIPTGGDNQPIIPMQQIQVAQTPTDIDGTLSDLEMYIQNLRAQTPTPFALDPRFAAAEGGVARQAYGLGSLVRKATKGIKKILKSDVGKAALVAAGAYGMTRPGFSSFISKKVAPMLLKDPSSKYFGLEKGLTGIGQAALIAGPSALAYFTTPEEEEDNLSGISDRTDTSGLRELMARYPALRFQVPTQYQLAANGGRMGYEEGGNIDPADLPMSREGFPTYEDTETGEEVEYPYGNEKITSAPDIDAELFQMYLDAVGSGKIPKATTFDQYKELMNEMSFKYRDDPYGPFIKEERTMANEGGLMSLGGNEMDLRGGGFVPIGKQEKADDVPARLSKNEFVFTADAVRAAGGGDVDKGADLMYKTMKDLESRVG